MLKPKIKFSKWYTWADWSDLPYLDRRGVYLLAHFDEAPRGPAKPTNCKIVDIGETCTKLRSRLRDFSTAASYGSGGHSGGNTYHTIFVKSSKSKQISNGLHVSAFPVQPLDFEEDYRSDIITKTFVRYTERKLIFEYATLNKKLPVCNKK